ncbi:MAG: aminoglycoside adenylyltransferase domain-containing protein [Chloroflexota bacterium]
MAVSRRQPIPGEVRELLDDVLDGVQTALGDSFVGLYVRGSLALGDFDDYTSDVDLVAVMEQPLDEAQFRALRAMHRRIESSRSPYVPRYEITYLDRLAVRRFVPGERHATLRQGGSLEWVEHRVDWIIERWVLREHGFRILGPDPHALIDPITSDQLIEANRQRLADWRSWLDDPSDGAWAPKHGQMAYVVETMCRCRYAVATGSIATKPQAVRWALEAFPEPWRTTVRRSHIWRADSTIDPKIVPEVRRFVEWATTHP